VEAGASVATDRWAPVFVLAVGLSVDGSASGPCRAEPSGIWGGENPVAKLSYEGECWGSERMIVEKRGV